ncbi:bile acid-CoA:amino acid N-acyltransferase-like isoform X2 [Hyperolius riggenbachi]|uniref:bile acid-CoA:amino acid N-acyltransferase-like isoform X2 n=1 Tax=Hyperolius riggenbachi TaxID=752182 RepID=UPI0035A3CD65
MPPSSGWRCNSKVKLPAVIMTTAGILTRRKQSPGGEEEEWRPTSGSPGRDPLCPAMVLLTVSPEVALADEPVKIRAWELPAQQIITIRAWLKDEKGELFYSRAFYRSDDEGKVDLEHAPATGGDFCGVHPMGLFWALKSMTPLLKLVKRDVMGSPFEIHLEVYCHLEMNAMPECSPEAIACLRRWYVAPGVQRVQVREGRVRGALFLPPECSVF